MSSLFCYVFFFQGAFFMHFRILSSIFLNPLGKFCILPGIDLDAAVQKTDEALAAELIDQLADGNPRASHNRAQLILGIMNLQIVPLALHQPGCICCEEK